MQRQGRGLGAVGEINRLQINRLCQGPCPGRERRRSMKRNKNLIYDEAGPYFVTTAIDRFIPVFEEAKLADIAIDNLDFYRKKYGCKLYAYVVMPDHLHLIVDMHGSP